MEERDIDLLGERLNLEPVVFRGYTDSELTLTLKLCGLVYAPVGILGGFIAGNVGIGLAMALVGTLATVFLGANLFQRLKRGRPDYYLEQQAHLTLARWGFIRCAFAFQGEHPRFRFPDGASQMSLGRTVWPEHRER